MRKKGLPETIDPRNTVAIAILEKFPGVKPEIIERAQKAGITENNIQTAIQLAEVHKKKFGHIVRWLEMGVGLGTLEQALAIHEYMPKATVRILGEYIDRLGFRTESPDKVLEVFDDFFQEMDVQFPAHRLLHIIDDVFVGDIHTAYQMALQNPDELMNILRHQLSDTIRGWDKSGITIVEPGPHNFERDE